MDGRWQCRRSNQCRVRDRGEQRCEQLILRIAGDFRSSGITDADELASNEMDVELEVHRIDDQLDLDEEPDLDARNSLFE